MARTIARMKRHVPEDTFTPFPCAECQLLRSRAERAESSLKQIRKLLEASTVNGAAIPGASAPLIRQLCRLVSS
jgi:hypothetical protein